MSLRTRAVGLAAALSLAVPVIAAVPVAAAPVTPAAVPTPPSAANAVGWLSAQLTAGTHLQTPVNGSFFDDYGLTADAVLAFDTAKVGTDYATSATSWLSRHVADYAGDGSSSSYAGALAKLALVAMAQGLDPTNFGGRNLLAELEARQDASGRFSDLSGFGDFSNAVTQSLAVIAERRAGRSPVVVAKGLASLLTLQCSDHGFALYYAPTPCGSTNPSDNDATANAVQAGTDQTTPSAAPAAIGLALDHLVSEQQSDGGMAEQSGGVANANSTGLAAIAFAIGGRTSAATAAATFVAGLQQPGTAADTRIGAVTATAGAFAFDTAVRATPQGVFGLQIHDAGPTDLSGSYELVTKTGAVATIPVPARTSGSFQAILPTRLVDTRKTAAIPAGSTLDVVVAGQAGVPADASAAGVNITAVTPTGSGFVSAYPAGTSRPITSVLNLITGITAAGSTVVTLGAGGAFTIYNGSSHPLNVVVDVSGYTRAGAGRAAGSYRTVVPTRLLDTRKTAAIPAGGTVDVAVRGSAVDASSDAAAALLTLTSVTAGGSGFLTAYPSGTTRPIASNVNLIAGQTIANAAVVRIGANGRISLYNGSSAPLNVVVDISGYIVSGIAAFRGTFVPLNPARVLDTRTTGAIAPGGSQTLALAGVGGIPATGAMGAIFNVTAVAPTGSGYLVTYPTGITRPNISTVNLVTGRTVANLTATGFGVGEHLDVSNQSAHPANVVMDVAGYVRG